MNFHNALSLMVLQNLVSGKRAKGFGICRRKWLDLNRYGNGACCIMVYAIT